MPSTVKIVPGAEHAILSITRRNGATIEILIDLADAASVAEHT
jgi:hypothetical protein